MEKRFIVVGIAAVGVAIAGATWWYRGMASLDVFSSEPVASGSTESATSTAMNAAPLATSVPATEDAGQVAGQVMRRYTNTAFHFSLLYPATLQATEYKEQGAALTVTFVNPATDEQFQIYVTPYSQSQVSAERFKQDEPSGVRLEPTDIMVGGVRATMFFSTNAVMGDTREVWFIRKGFLYEVTTYKELDTWLGDIMQTWKFL